jgi:hypothetical protein
MRRHRPAAWLHFEQLAGWPAELSRSAIHPSRWCHALHALPPPTHSSTAPIPARFQHLSKRVLEVTFTAACWISDGVGGRFFLLPQQHVGFFHTHTHTWWIVGGNLSFLFPPFLGLSSFKKKSSAYLCVFHLFFSSCLNGSENASSGEHSPRTMWGPWESCSTVWSVMGLPCTF